MQGPDGGHVGPRAFLQAAGSARHLGVQVMARQQCTGTCQWPATGRQWPALRAGCSESVAAGLAGRLGIFGQVHVRDLAVRSARITAKALRMTSADEN